MAGTVHMAEIAEQLGKQIYKGEYSTHLYFDSIYSILPSPLSLHIAHSTVL